MTHCGRQARFRLLAVSCCILPLACGQGASPESDQERKKEPGLCVATTPIGEIQGEGYSTPLAGARVTVRGVVSLVVRDGIYIQSTSPDASERTSEGLFLSLQRKPGFVSGDVIAATGLVAELGTERDTQTALSEVSEITQCRPNALIPRTRLTLPLDNPGREALENMQVEWQQPLAAADVYNLKRGFVDLAVNTALAAPTEIAEPGEAASQQARTNREQRMRVLLPVPPPAIRHGTAVPPLAGVLAHDGKRQYLHLDSPLNLPEQAPPTLAPPEPGQLRVLGLNLHNYFNGDGQGGGFPTERGAETVDEFAEQHARVVATILEARAQIVAVMELENDGFGPQSAAATLAGALTQASGADWRFVDPGTPQIGTDAITVGLFYQSDQVQTVGEALLLSDKPFERGNRVPLAQAVTTGNESFLVVVNHFKSKGSCPERGADKDQRDGQGCWNRARTRAAQSLLRQISPLAEAQSAGQALLLGDFNAYRQEDPIEVLLDGGFHELTGSTPTWSYVYFGEAGTLDYAFASPALTARVAGARHWHINAGYPPDMPSAYPWLGASDHDPVVVDLDFSQSPTSD